MFLLPGTRLGPYEILTRIGSGGMGVVYKARDPRLHRDVAIKLIRLTHSRDPGHLMQRLEQEARAVAHLNHPNILQVYDVGSHENSPFVVMELLVGETLRQRLAGGPLPIRKATDIIIQVANGLAAAHGKGISHRDLKPENVFLTRDDRVKILDFGLAKPMATPGTPEQEATGTFPSGEPNLTEEGAVMGTAGYLSPEQIRGKGADARSDIFALGAMFYEMLLGTRPFQGGTSVETMAAILREEVAFPAQGGVVVPPALEHLIRVCLEKEPSSRFQTAWDLALALQTVRTHGSGSGSAGALSLPDPPRFLDRPWRKGLLTLAAVAVAIPAVLLFRLAISGGSGTLQAEWIPITVRPGLTATARFSPDGETVVYSSALGSAAPTVHSIRIGQVLPRQLGMVGQVMAAGEDGAILFIQSPQRVHPGAAAVGMLAELLADGTEARPLLERTESADRSRDGRQLVVVRVETGAEGRRNILECPPGHSLLRTSRWLYCPRLSPDGTRISVLESEGPDNWFGRVRVVGLDGETRFLSEPLSIQSQAWSPDGREILFTRSPGTIEAMDLQGGVRPILRGPYLLHLYDATADGRLLVSSYQDRTEVFVASEDQAPRSVPLKAWAARLSADGGQLLFTGPGPKGGDMTYLQRTEGEILRPVAAGKLLGASEDGSTALLKRDRALFRVPTGPGAESAVPLGELGTVWRAAFLADGKQIAVVAAAPGRDFQLHIVNLATGRQVTLAGSEGARQVVPAGPRELVADVPEGGLKRFTVDGSAGTTLNGARPGDLPLRLKAGGGQLFVQEAYGEPGVLRVCTIDLRTGQRKVWRTLEFTVHPGLRNAQVLSITPDGRTVACFTWAQPNDLFAVAGVLEGRRTGRLLDWRWP